MFRQPKVSVIVLIYNVEQYIERCVESLYNQSLESLEYIFVDDCSTDRSIEVLRKIMSKYPERADNSIIVANKTNQGQAKGRINGINYAHGKYVIFCDSDDSVAHNAYQDMYDYIESTKDDIAACDFYRVYNDTTNKESYLGNDTIHDWIKNILISKKMGSLCCHLIKRDLFVDLLTPKGNIMEDTVILLQCLLKANRVSTYKVPLYYYYYRSDSIYNNSEKVLEQAKHMQANLFMISSLLSNFQEQLKNEIQYRSFFIKRWLLPIIKNTKDCRLWIDFEPKLGMELFENPYLSIKDKVRVLSIYLRLYPFIKKL